jgi:hypothetical protein
LTGGNAQDAGGCGDPCWCCYSSSRVAAGYRFILRRDGGRVRAFTRRGYDRTERLPRIAATLAALKVASATIDGEVVACGADRVADFERLRTALARRGSPETFLYAFDLFELDGEDLRPLPWENPPSRARAPAAPRRRRHPNLRAPHRRARPGDVPRGLSAQPQGYRVEAPRQALPLRALGGLDQGEESGRAGPPR